MRNPRYIFISKDKIKIFPTPIKNVSNNTMGNTMGFISTDPKYNKPQRSICAKCGKSFVHGPWSNVYSANYSYRFADPQDFGLVSLCDECAEKELALGHVELIMY